MNDTPRILKTAAMLVATPRYVGLMLYLSGFVFTPAWLSWLHIAEAVAGLSLAVLEGFALAYILSRRQLGFSRTDKIILYVVVALLLLLLPVCATPYLLYLFDGSNLFVVRQADFVEPVVVEQSSSVADVFKFIWAAATASMPILIVIGVALVEKDPVDIEILNAERQALLQQTLSRIRAETEQTLSRIEAETEQITLQYKLQAQQARAEHRVEKQHIEKQAQQSTDKPFTCDICGAAFESNKALAGHIGHCRAKTTNGKLAEREVDHA